jgi:hypothetical protein
VRAGERQRDGRAAPSFPGDVKRHTINIYAKLGVNKRWKAVARAEELDLLPVG